MKIYCSLLALLLAVAGAPALAAASKDSAQQTPAPAPPPVVDAPPVTAPPQKHVTTGEYHDASGKKHAWMITPSHMLRWDNDAYLPVGGAFTPHYWAEGQTEENWAKDVKALDAIKAQHVHDLYLYAGARGLTHVPPAAAQRVIDYLDQNEFRYGIAIADPAPMPLMGYVIHPAVYRDASPGPSTTFAHVDGLISATYVLASAQKGEIEETGKAKVQEGTTAVATLRSASDDSVLLLYPERLFADGTPESRMPDLWQGYDDYRDRLLTYFGKVKLGAGFRFFLDPLTDQLGVNGDADSLIPTSDGFRLEFQAWLQTKYHRNVNDVNQAWGVKDRDIPDYTVVARCIPLWLQTKGVAGLYDPVDGKIYEVLNKPRIANGFWEDFTKFRTESLRRYMNSIATVLKTSVADVPVVYRAPKFDSLFVNDATDGGYDGLGIEAFGHGRALAEQSALFTYAQSEDTPKSTWLIVSNTFGAQNAAEQKDSGYGTKGSLFDDFDYLKDSGARGFFTTALQRLPEAEFASANLASQTDQLGWLGSYAASLQELGDMREKDPDPILWYPAESDQIAARPRHFPDGVWWLPTLRSSSAFSMGLETVIQVYRVPAQDPGLSTWAVWTGQSAVREVRFPFNQTYPPVVTDARGIPLKIKGKNGVWTLPLGPEPILVSHVKGIPRPTELVDEAAAEAARLIKVAKAQHIATQRYEDSLFYANNSIADNPGSDDLRYSLVTRLISQLTESLRPYAWIEGEAASDFTFDSLAASKNASGGSYLSLDTDRDSQHGTAVDSGYHATYNFSVNAPGRYTIWLAGSPLDSSTASPFTYSVDGAAVQDTHDVPAEGPSYGGGFVWTNLGETTLDAKRHTLTIDVTGRSKDNRYRLDIDALCLSRVEFHPNGLTPPPIDQTTPPPAPTERNENAKR
ncbi:hypothetical protein CCAX7_31940 [Capsulimonas corticalis]|uniref:Uncharacterized protein n=1 Tax=Capsulimonas corticalis TaxID=2219043 RepID=A0A402D4C2_9BACT|nr:hypothetical protein [Capsulimonas corticalis]BDI31143.1 hypothetical protein CCAX7_31940 [Capsulimonas corticalis]